MNIAINENIYGHKKRLKWIVSMLQPSDAIVEFGCGTGLMITLPLAKMGYSILGTDSDAASIAYGQKLCKQQLLEPNILKTIGLDALDAMADVFIASEVLEHLSNDVLNSTLVKVREKLKPGGKLLVTVPNGYGWFEVESFLWNNLFIGRCLERLGIVFVVNGVKQLALGKDIEPAHPSTLSSSPHIQRFKLKSIQKSLIQHGFKILDTQGSVLFSGQFSNLFFTGIKPIMNLNTWLGNKFPQIASGFYIAAMKRT